MSQIIINATLWLMGYLPLWERLPAAIRDGNTVRLRYSRLEAAPTRYKPYSCYKISLSCYRFSVGGSAKLLGQNWNLHFLKTCCQIKFDKCLITLSTIFCRYRFVKGLILSTLNPIPSTYSSSSVSGRGLMWENTMNPTNPIKIILKP
jgi:hypothetical protein